MTPKPTEEQILALISEPILKLPPILEALSLAAQLDSYSPTLKSKLGMALCNGLAHRLTPEGLPEAEKIVLAYGDLADRLALSPAYQEAIASGAVRGPASKPGKAREVILAKLVPRNPENFVLAFDVASVYASAGDSANACAWLRIAMGDPKWGSQFPHESKFDPIRETSDFKALLAEKFTAAAPDKVYHLSELAAVPDAAQVLRISMEDASNNPKFPEAVFGFPRLKELNLRGKYLLNFDQLVPELKRFPGFQTLNLTDCHLTLRRLPVAKLRELPSLKTLILGAPDGESFMLKNLFTESEQAELRALLPGVRIEFPPRADQFDELRDFGSSFPEKATAHIADRELKLLFWHLKHDAYRTLRFAERLARTHPDQATVQEAIGLILEKFCQKLDGLKNWEEAELVEQFGWDFGYMRPAEVRGYFAKQTALLEALRKSGPPSEAFVKFRQALDPKKG